MKTITPKEQRVQRELKNAGVTSYGLHKGESRYVVELIHEDEQIKAVAYGRHVTGSAMLVATDKRVLFVDKKPLFKTSDELTYDVVSGIKLTKSGPFSSLVLHTRVGDYALRYVSAKSAGIFKKYLEAHLLEHPSRTFDPTEPKKRTPVKEQILSEAEANFLHSNELATLSTVDRTGNVYGAVVYYFAPSYESVYVLTKANTQKTRNVFAHPQVGLTIYDTESLQTLQLQGEVEVVSDDETKREVFKNIIKPPKHEDKRSLPVMQLEGQDFLVLQIKITSSKFTDFKQQSRQAV